MFSDTFFKQRDLFNNMKDKQMIIDYIVFNVDLILSKIINLYRDYNQDEIDKTSLKSKVYSTLGDFSQLLPLIFTNDYIDDIIYIGKADAIPYHNIIIPYDTSMSSRHFFRYMLFTMWMTMTNNHDILENIKFIMYSKISEDNNRFSTPFVCYCKENSHENTISLQQGNDPNRYFNTTCYMSGCRRCILSKEIDDNQNNPCYLMRSKNMTMKNIMESFYYSFSCGLLLSITTHEDKIKSDMKKLGLRNNNKAKKFKQEAYRYISYCVNKRKGLIYDLREEIIKTAIVDVFSDAQVANFFSGINALNNYIVKSEKRYKNGL